MAAAICHGRLDVVQFLINELDADVNQEIDLGSNALFYAASRGHLDIMWCLVREYGADINHTDHEEYTPLMVTVQSEHAVLAQWLVNADANINCTNCIGFTALMLAAKNDNAALTKWLVKACADPQAKNADEENAADISRRVGASTE
jgi:ankyrin repeat protein